MRSSRQLSRLALALLLALATLAGAGSRALAADRPNGAGLVIRFGDGRIVTAYVEFQEPAISGIELLQRAGIPITVAPFGGLGLAVCAIGGEGCPAEDCFCQAKQQPARFWHYYGLTRDGRWVLHAVGASSRVVRDGDVDGWSWTTGESGLPAITIDDIARAHGVERAPAPLPAAPTPTPTSAPPPPPAPPTAATAPTVAPATPPPAPTPTVAERPEPTAAGQTVASPSPSSTPTAHATVTSAPTATDASPPHATPARAAPGASSVTAAPTPAPASAEETGPPWTALALVGVAALLLAIVIALRRGPR